MMTIFTKALLLFPEKQNRAASLFFRIFGRETLSAFAPICAKAGLAALIALGGIAATAPAASAASDGYGGGYVRDGRDGPRHDGRGWERPDRGRDRCSPWLAEERASRMGLRRARVVDVSPRRVTVAGFDRHGRSQVVV